MKTERWYQKRLSNYFMEHYAHYEDDHDIGWYNNPAPNVWKFTIPHLRKLIVLICNDDGHVNEQVYKIM